jgi:glycosyltransferase involved in cell wall biosynthesis
MEQAVGVFGSQVAEKRVPEARILQIGNFPPPLCGWAIHTLAIQRALIQRGAECKVLDLGPCRRLDGRECIPVYGGLDYLAKLIAFRARGYTFELHTNGDTWKRFLLVFIAALLGRLTGRPPVLMFHAGPQQMLFPRKHGFWFHAFQLLFRCSAQIICNMDSVKNVILSYGIPAERVHSIFSIHYQDEGLPAPLAENVERFLEAHAPKLFSYTLFRPEFTMECLFDAFARIRLKFPQAGLLIAGPREVPTEAQEYMRRSGIESAVLVAGNLPREQFLTAISRSDVFIRTHLRDGLCSSVIEALKLGTPVVAAEDGIRPPSVFKYAPGDSHSLTRVALEVLNDLKGARAQVRAPEVNCDFSEEVSLLVSVATLSR